MEMTQFQRDLVRMWDSVRTHHKGNIKCLGVPCDKCPLVGHVCGTHGTTFYAEKTIEIVTAWAKEHPLVTNRDKFKEDWGTEPCSIGGIYLCPSYFGFEECVSPCGDSNSEFCISCKEKFWHSEHKPPKKEG